MSPITVDRTANDPRAKSAVLPVTLVVLTFNEERNLDACLASLTPFVTASFVVDSGSTDRTREIAAAHGAEIVVHPFESHARQWKWALDNLPLATDWVLALDADQRATPDLLRAIGSLVDDGARRDVVGGYVVRRQMFRGRWIRHGGYYPKHLLKLFRREAVAIDEGDLVDHHFRVNGRTAVLGADIIEENQNENVIATWIAKHNRYAVLQAREEFERRRVRTKSPGRFFGAPDERVLWLKAIWERLPLYVRPCLYFTYRYVIRLGFLDGREGFVFHVLQGFWYRLLVDINLEELDRAAATPVAGKETA